YPFRQLFPTQGSVVHVFLTRSPLHPKVPFNLHALGTPPALILSQDQTLRQIQRQTPSCLAVHLIKTTKNKTQRIVREPVFLTLRLSTYRPTSKPAGHKSLPEARFCCQGPLVRSGRRSDWSTRCRKGNSPSIPKSHSVWQPPNVGT